MPLGHSCEYHQKRPGIHKVEAHHPMVDPYYLCTPCYHLLMEIRENEGEETPGVCVPPLGARGAGATKRESSPSDSPSEDYLTQEEWE